MDHTNLRSNFSLLHAWPTCMEHPAWKAFVREMAGKAYGREALNTAWSWFRTGWDRAWS